MGWTFYGDATQTKESFVKEITASGSNYTTVRVSVVGNHVWAIQRVKYAEGDERPMIVLFLIAKSRAEGHGWGYKDMTESMGPNYYTCPLHFLDLVEPPASQYAAGWREKVRAHHAAKAKRRELRASVKVGSVVKLHAWCKVGGRPVDWPLTVTGFHNRTIYVDARVPGAAYAYPMRLHAQHIAEVLA